MKHLGYAISFYGGLKPGMALELDDALNNVTITPVATTRLLAMAQDFDFSQVPVGSENQTNRTQLQCHNPY